MERTTPAINPWLVAIAVMAGTFMEVLDTTIVNVSLPHIAGNLSASNEEATWVLTSYLVANAVILPMTGWLANHFGRKRLLMTSVIGFTASSFLCGLAPSLGFLIVFRVIQGLTGGGLQPLSQAILLESFPPQKRGMAMAFWGLGIVVAPMLGPMVGGWLTDNASWRWVFYVNVPIGLFAITMTEIFIFDPPYIKRREGGIDLWGMGFLVLGIGALQIMLDKGQQDDWFSSRLIVTLFVLAVGGIVAMIWRELTAEHPIVDLRVFKNRTWATGTFLMTVLGFVLFGSTVLLPLVMQTLLGYTAFQAGLTNVPRGIASFIMMPAIGFLMAHVEPRKILAVGLVVVSTSLFLVSRLSLDAGPRDFILPLVLQGAAMAMIFIPLTTVTNDPIPKEQIGNATSLFNLMRNIGGSFGIAIVTTILARNTQTHVAQLGGHVDAFDPATAQRLAAAKSALMARGADAWTAANGALAAVWGDVQRQAAFLSYRDAFLFLSGLFIAMVVLIPLMRKPTHQREGGGMAH
ncbi:MAG TPA: DHA2 family efflux MFS transporter permease subunit [Candidatus Polarisedimenticolaceae bacterium]|nr:DHA2 family efflux MFS transporter permease subunit [Candidatus Polarisedimenticolaceae bacterium]